MVHCIGPDWAFWYGVRSLYSKVWVSINCYNKHLGHFFASIQQAPSYIRNQFDIGTLDVESKALIERAKVDKISKVDFANLANDLAVYLCNSDVIRELVIHYYRQKIDIFTTELNALSEVMNTLPAAECVLYSQMIGHLSNKVTKKTDYLGFALDKRPPVVKKKLTLPDDSDSESSDESSSEEEESSEKDDNSAVLEDAAPALPVRDKSPVRMTKAYLRKLSNGQGGSGVFEFVETKPGSKEGEFVETKST